MNIKKVGLSLISLLLILNIVGCSTKEMNESNRKDKELVVADWGGPYTDAHKKASFEPFEKKYGVKVTVVTPPDMGKLKAMVESGNVEWDVVAVDDYFAVRAGSQGILEKLDFNVISKDGLPEELVHDYAVPDNLFSTVMAYNTDVFPEGNHPNSWVEFWDTENFRGPRALNRYAPSTLEAALLADGVEPQDLYPLDVDRAFAKLDKLKSDITVWWTAGAQPPELLASNEVSLSVAWSGRITEVIKQGAPVGIEFNQGFIAANSWVVPKGAPNKELAMQLIAFMLEPEQQAAFSANYDNAPANTNALPLLSHEVKNRLGQSNDKREKQIFVNSEWWIENFEEVDERFQQWLLE